MNEICIKELRFPTSCRPKMKFHAHLIYEISNPPNILLKVYYDINEGPAILQIQNQILGGKSSEVIKIMEVNSSDIIDITIIDDYIYRIKDSITSFYDEKIGSQYFEIYLKGIKIETKVATKEQSKSYFHLNSPSTPLIGDNYSFLYYDYGKWEAKNRDDIAIRFDDVEIGFQMLYHQETDFLKTDKLTINQTPVISANYSTSKGLHVEKSVEISCLLASFFLAEDINFYKGVYYSNNKKTLILKTVNNLSNNPKRYQCKHSKYKNFNSFLNSIGNKDILFDKFNIFKQLISKFILAYHLSSESRFMIFYNIIENIREHFYPQQNTNRKTKFEFNFNTKREEKEFFNSIKKQLIKNISDEDREIFTKIIQGLKGKINYIPNLNLFQDFFDEIDVSPQEFNLDFKIVNSLRNRIFHGTLKHGDNNLIQVNKKIHRFTAKLIRVLINSEDDNDFQKRMEKEFEENGILH